MGIINRLSVVENRELRKKGNQEIRGKVIQMGTTGQRIKKKNGLGSIFDQNKKLLKISE